MRQFQVLDPHQASVPMEERSRGEQEEKRDMCMGSTKPWSAYGVLWRTVIGRFPASEEKRVLCTVTPHLVQSPAALLRVAMPFGKTVLFSQGRHGRIQ